MSENIKGFSQAEFEAVLKSMHRVMRAKNVTDDVPVKFRVLGQDECRVWRCRTTASGKTRCGWEPC